MNCKKCDCIDFHTSFKTRHKVRYYDDIEHKYDFNNSEFSHDDYDYLYYMDECSSCGYEKNIKRIKIVDIQNCYNCQSKFGRVKNCKLLEEGKVKVEAECCNCGSIITGEGEPVGGLIEKLDPRK